MPRLTTGVYAGDEFGGTRTGLGAADVAGGAWQDNSTMGVSGGKAVKTSGSGSARGFSTLANPTSRIVSDGVTTSASPTLTSATAAFTTADEGRPVYGTGIPAGTTILTCNSTTSVTMSANATVNSSALTIVINDITLDFTFVTNATVNFTDAGVSLMAKGSWSTQGGQLYMSFRKISGQNSHRIMHRTNTSGSDSALQTNSSAGWADNTSYDMKVVRVGKTIDVLRRLTSVGGAYSSILTGGVPFTLTDAVLNTLGTNVGISFTNTDTGGGFEDFFGVDSLYVPPGPTPTSVKLLYHRGSKISLARTYEEHSATFALLTVGGSGPEVDARRPSDYATTHKTFLLHDTDFAPASPNGGSGSALTANTATYVANQIEELTAFLDGCIGYNFDSIIVQLEIDVTSEMVDVVNVIQAHPVGLNVILATSATAGATPRMDRMRAAGWLGRILCYGVTTTNYPTLKPDFITYAVSILMLALGDTAYDANRSLVATMITDGFKPGASTITTAKFALAISDGVAYILTDYSDEFLASYTPPANLPAIAITSRTSALAIGQPVVAASGAVSVAPTSRVSALLVGQPSVAATGSGGVSTSTRASTLAVGQPSVSATDNAAVSPTSRASALVVGQPSISGDGDSVVAPGTRASALAVGQPAVSATGNVSISPGTRASARIVNSPTVSLTGGPPPIGDLIATFWNGTAEVPLNVAVWNGTTEVPSILELSP